MYFLECLYDIPSEAMEEYQKCKQLHEEAMRNNKLLYIGIPIICTVIAIITILIYCIVRRKQKRRRKHKEHNYFSESNYFGDN